MGQRRLALLAAVAAAGEPGLTRERLVGLFWPDVDEERGRHSLRQTLHALRSEAGPVLLQGGSSLKLDPRLVTSDVTEFHTALAAGRRAEALEWYRGPFLDGFYLSGAPEFERWVEQERARLAEAASTALRVLAVEAARVERHDEALDWWRRLSLLEPLSGRTAISYASELVASGDRAEALAVLRGHAIRVEQELEAPPDAGVSALIAELQRRPHPPPARLPEAVSAQRRGGIPAVQEPTSHHRPGLRLAGLATVVLLALIFGARWWATGGQGAGGEVGTDSPVARRLYEEGLGRLRGGDPEVARPLMEAALNEDSLFALAAYYLAVMGEGESAELRVRALRLAQRAPERVRLRINADLLQRNLDPGAVEAARNWAARFPDDGEAAVVLGSALFAAGEWEASAASFDRALGRFGAGGEDGAGCRRCEAYDWLIDLYLWWDSLPAVERTARRSLLVRSDRTSPIHALALAAARGGDSLRAMQHLRNLASKTDIAVNNQFELRILLTLERYDEVEVLARQMLASPRPADVKLGKWMWVIALRNQGRLVDATDLLRTGRVSGMPLPSWPPDPDYPAEAVVALESREPVRAAALFEINRDGNPGRAAGARARWFAWHSTLTATALAAAGDTATVRQLADTVAYWGERTLYGRDRKAHHFVRGLLLVAQGEDSAAVEEYRQAIHSPSLGYTRVNLELARALLRLRRPAEAIPVLQAALRGEVDASNLYVTRTELHEVLAEAFEQAGKRDSAVVHWGRVVTALARADPGFTPRRIAAAAAVRRLGKVER